jgi:5'-deoxynucleotidase YfbR-like HD superfamily hydrolase
MASRQLAGRVERWHTWPMIRRPTVMEHAGRVASLFCELWGIPRGEVLYYCLHHDHGEFTAGDVPFSAKELAPNLRESMNFAEAIGRDRLGIILPEINQEEFLRFKICDLLEMFETAIVEWNMGNRYAGCVVVDCANTALDMAHKVDLLVSGNRTACRDYIEGWVYKNGYKGAATYDVF